jgi:hypothetical protein
MAKAAGELAKDHAVDAINDAKALRDMLSIVDGQIGKTADEVANASSDDARQAAVSALEKLKQEKDKIEARLAALKDATAP